MPRKSSSPKAGSEAVDPLPAGLGPETRQARKGREARDENAALKLEGRRQRITKGAIFNLNSTEDKFVKAVAGGASLQAAAAAAGCRTDRLDAAVRRMLKRPIVQAALYQYLPKPSEEQQALLAQAEIYKLALMPDHLLADQPRWVDKRWALEQAIKLQGLGVGEGLAAVGAAAVNYLVAAAQKRAAKTPAITLDAEQQPENAPAT